MVRLFGAGSARVGRRGVEIEQLINWTQADVALELLTPIDLDPEYEAPI